MASELGLPPVSPADVVLAERSRDRIGVVATAAAVGVVRLLGYLRLRSTDRQLRSRRPCLSIMVVRVQDSPAAD